MTHFKDIRQKRIKINDEEYDKKLGDIFFQCFDKSNHFFKEASYDVICDSITIFKSLGITLKQLCKWRKKLPVYYPWDDEYDSLRLNVNRYWNVFPLIISLCNTEQDVIDSFLIAKKYGIHISCRSGRHCALPFSLTSGMVIDQYNRKKITLLPKSINDDNVQLVNFEAGCLLGPIASELSKYNLAVASGTCANNGMAGYTLGGGIGFLTRNFGMSCDNLVEARVLLANGKMVLANKNKNSDLYFAIRGAGNGNYGIITSMTMKAHKVDVVSYYNIVYSNEQLTELMKLWQSLLPTFSSKFETKVEAFNGGGNVSLTGIYLGSLNTLNRILEPFLNLDYISKTIERKKYIDVASIYSASGRWYNYMKPHSCYMKVAIPESGLQILQKYMSLGSGRDFLEIDAMGAAVDKYTPRDTAFVHREVLYWMLINVHADTLPEFKESVAWGDKLFRNIFEYSNKQCYQNMFDDDLKYPLKNYYDENLDKLMKIKSKYDPENIFSYEQSIPPAFCSAISTVKREYEGYEDY